MFLLCLKLTKQNYFLDKEQFFTEKCNIRISHVTGVGGLQDGLTSTFYAVQKKASSNMVLSVKPKLKRN